MPDRTKAPAVTNFTDIHLEFPSQITLSNGIKAFVIGNGEDEICRISWLTCGGKFQELKPMQASLTAATMLEGSKSYTSVQVAEAFDYFGALTNGYALDFLSLSELLSLNDTLGDVLPYFVDGVVNPTFTSEIVAHKRSVVAGNLSNMSQKVRYLASREMARIYYGESHPLARKFTPSEVESLMPEDLKQFHSDNILKYLGQSKIVVAGHVTDRELAIIDDRIGQLPVGDLIPPTISYPVVHDSVRWSVVDKPGAVQSAIYVTFDAVPRTHPDYLKLRLLVIALGGYFGSRLMQNIREDKGYTYGIGSVLAGRADEAHIEISTECATKYTHEVIKEIKIELKKLQDEPIGIEELESVKQNVLSDLAKTLDTPLSVADYVNTTFTYGVYPEYFNNQVAEVQEATSAELQELASRYFDFQKMRIVVAGDKSVIGTIN